MKTIHKHRLKVVNEVQELRLPEEGKVLRVDYIPQEAVIFMWVEVDADTVIDTPKECAPSRCSPPARAFPTMPVISAPPLIT